MRGALRWMGRRVGFVVVPPKDGINFWSAASALVGEGDITKALSTKEGRG